MNQLPQVIPFQQTRAIAYMNGELEIGMELFALVEGDAELPRENQSIGTLQQIIRNSQGVFVQTEVGVFAYYVG